MMTMLLIGLLGLCLYSCCWPWMVAASPWGQLMQKYSMILTKIDVARGRCVPVPSYAPKIQKAASKFSLLIHPKVPVIERIIDALNPYTASPNIRLILDMVAYKSGLGVALRNLAFLEIDVHNNWRPFRPQISFAIDHLGESALDVSWKDPLAVLYLVPVPDELQLHYGIEIEYGSGQQDEIFERVVEIVGYQESRYFRQIWRYHRKGSCGSDVGDSTLTLNQENESIAEASAHGGNGINNEPFTYRETFSHIYPPNNGTVKVTFLILFRIC